MLPDLNHLLNYKNSAVTESYIRDFNVSKEKADVLFGDMLRYLWLSNKHSLDKKRFPKNKSLQFVLVMHEEMRDIDNMWHNFILYTYDYMTFCNTYFGEFLHHQRDMAEVMEKTNAGFSGDLEKYLLYVYDELGEVVVKRWFAPYCE